MIIMENLFKGFFFFLILLSCGWIFRFGFGVCGVKVETQEDKPEETERAEIHKLLLNLL